MNKPIIGISAYSGAADIPLMKKAGIGWIRHHFPWPFAGDFGGTQSDGYLIAKSQAKDWHAAGMNILGMTPMFPLIWPQCGEPGSEESLRRYEAVCAWLADDLSGLVTAWQVANEVDFPPFQGGLNIRQACELVVQGARGLKRMNPSLMVGTNATEFPRSYYLFGYLYGRPYEKDNISPFDYCGVDGYYGTVGPDGPEQWDERIADLHALTGMPVMINEWGYHSSGETMTEEEMKAIIASMPKSEREFGIPACGLKKLPFAWGKGHTPETQAEYIRAALNIFQKHRDKLAGIVFYCWQDEERCRYCGSPECPVTSRQGLVDVEGRPKPGYYAFREGVRSFLVDDRSIGSA